MSFYEPAPDWLNEILKKRKHYTEAPKNPLTELDTEENKTRAIAYLTDHAPSAIAFQGGNDTTYKVATRLRDFGLSEGVAFDLLADHWNPAKADPPWPPEDLEKIVSNAYAYATGGWGGMSGLAEFGDATEEFKDDFLESEEKNPYRAYSLFEASDLAMEHEIDFLVKDILNRNSMAIVYGPSGSGKSFLVLDIAFHIAAGIPWNGHETKKGAILYVATEGGIGVLKRCAALRKHYDVKEEIPFYILTYPVDFLRSAKDIKAVLKEARRIEQETGETLQMVVLDTVARAMAGGDENTSKDMGQFIKNVDALQEKLQCTTLLVHHTGKEVARGARGWSGLRAATDTEIEILENTVRITKQRDIEFIEDIRFRLKKVPLKAGLDSCVIDFLEPNEFVQVSLTPTEKRVLDVIVELAKAQAVANDRPEDWQQEVVEGSDIRRQVEVSPWGKKVAVNNILTKLISNSQIKRGKHNQYVIAKLTDQCENHKGQQE